MNRRTKPELFENIPCDIKAGIGKTSHSPVTPAAESKTAQI